MAGITSIGAYIPMYRLSLEEITRFWRIKGAGGEKAVAGFDEDSITMAVAAALDCMKRSNELPQGLYFATTTNAYREKQGAAVIASAIDLKRESLTSDFTNSLRAATIAMRSAVDAVKGGSAKSILVTASDARLGGPQGRNEQILGDGAAAIIIGSGQTIADIEDTHSIFNDFTDYWRNSRDEFIQSAEGRFIDANGYMPTMQETISGLMKKHSLSAKDFSKIVFYATDLKEQAELTKRLGFDKAQVQDPLFAQIGNTGAAAAFMMLVAALEEAKAGDRILFAGYGDGCDAFILRATKDIDRARAGQTMKDRLARRAAVDYGKYLNWRNLVPIEAMNLPARSEPHLATRWRDRRNVSALYGVRCKKCGTPQIHPIGQNIRICAVCQAKDDFEEYRFSDKKGKLFSYAIDQLQPTKNPPGLNGVVDFDEGGRLICELTDYDLDKVKIGMPVEMSYRRMLQGQGIINYFWKAKPVA
ncbi:MAG: OB-fold domain-containing protein [Acidobacteria bacterium]|nr:OB-fold domain-containing protein [Acidobacteriota bacterium]